MKSVKLSLVAALVAGSLAASAGAVSLADAIGEVEVNGYSRLRYDNVVTSVKPGDNSYSNAKHRFTTEADFKAGFGDGFYGVVGFKYDSFDLSGDPSWANTAKYSQGNNLGTQTSFDVNHYYLGYKVGNTEVMLGRQTLGTFFTDDMSGTGVKVVNTDLPGLILAAVAFDNLENDSDGKALGLPTKNNASYTVGQNNLYGVAAIGSYAPVGFQIWAAGLENVLKYTVAGEVTGSFDLDAVKLTGKAQFSTNAASEKAVLDLLGDSTYYGVELKAAAGLGEGLAVDAQLGYVDFSTDKDKAGVITVEDAGALINTGFQLLPGRAGGANGYSLFAGENSALLASVGVKFLDKFRFSLEGVWGSNENTLGAVGGLVGYAKYDSTEYLARLNYAHNAKLSFQTFYSTMELKDKSEGSDKYTSDQFRVQAMYKF